MHATEIQKQSTKYAQLGAVGVVWGCVQRHENAL